MLALSSVINTTSDRYLTFVFLLSLYTDTRPEMNMMTMIVLLVTCPLTLLTIGNIFRHAVVTLSSV